MSERTLFDKVIDAHTVKPGQVLIGRKLIHEVTSNPACFERLRAEGLDLRFPETVSAVMDHILNTKNPDGKPFKNSTDELMAKTLEENVRDYGVKYLAPGSGNGGIYIVVNAEQGIVWPGMTVICGDSHTSSFGAFGAVGFGVGSTQLGHAMGSQTISPGERLKVRRINFTGELQRWVTAKDTVMQAIRKIGAKGGIGYAHEYGGEVMDRMNMEERVTMCNMGVEGGAKVAYINPDETTFAYLKGRPYAPKRDWDKAVEYWKAIASDKDAKYDEIVEINVSELEPMVSWGTVSDQSMGINDRIPDGADEKALKYMGLKSGDRLEGMPIDLAFIGSCTNGRLSDIAAAVEILERRKVAVKTLVVPGSDQVRAEADRLGYGRIIEEAGAEWRYPGCSICLSMSPDTLMNQERTASTSNRNFGNRQGKGAKTHLMSPYTAAASAITGRITDPREFL